MEKKKTLALFAIIATAIIWGLSFLSIKVAVAVIPPMTLALMRFVIGSTILSIIYRYKEKEKKLHREDIPIFALSGFIGVSAYFYFENNGISLIPASTASIIIAAIPIFTLIAEAIVFKNKLTPKKILTVIISFVGVYFIVGSSRGDLTSSSLKGYLLMFGAVLAWVVYTIITKPLYKKYSQIAIVFYQMLFGTIFLIPSVFFETTNWSLMDTTIVLNIIYLGVFCSAAAYFLYIYAMDYLGVSTTSLFLNLLPIIAVIGCYFILNEKIGMNQVIGGFLVIFAVFLVNSEKIDKEIKLENEELVNQM